jgi:hypothetical protein
MVGLDRNKNIRGTIRQTIVGLNGEILREYILQESIEPSRSSSLEVSELAQGDRGTLVQLSSLVSIDSNTVHFHFPVSFYNISSHLTNSTFYDSRTLAYFVVGIIFLHMLSSLLVYPNIAYWKA